MPEERRRWQRTPQEETAWKREIEYQQQLNKSAARSLFQESLEQLGFSRQRARDAVASDTFREIFFDSLSLSSRIQGWILEPARRRANTLAQKLVDAVSAGEHNYVTQYQRELQGVLDILPDAEAAARVTLMAAARKKAEEAYAKAQALKMAEIMDKAGVDKAESVLGLNKRPVMVNSSPPKKNQNQEGAERRQAEQAKAIAEFLEAK